MKKRISFWDLVAEAECDVATWPAWKRKAAERVYAMTNKRLDRDEDDEAQAHEVTS